MALYPVYNDDEFNLLQKIVINTADLAGSVAGDVSTVAGITGQILVNGTTSPKSGAIVLSLASAITGVNSITASAATDLTLNAGSGNQNVGLIFSGTGWAYSGLNNQPSSMTDARFIVGMSGSSVSLGVVSYGGSPLIRFSAALGTVLAPTHTLNGNTIGGFVVAGYTTDAVGGWSGSKAGILFSATQDWTTIANGNQIVFSVTPNGSTTRTDSMVLTQAAHLLLGGLTTDGTGVLQFPTGTTSAGGITLGNVNIFQSGSGTYNVVGNGTFGVSTAGSSITVDNVSGSSNATLSLTGRNAGVAKATQIFADQNGQLRIQSAAGQNISLESAGVAALTLDSSQNATFASQVSAGNYQVSSGNGFASTATNGTITLQGGRNFSTASAAITASSGTFSGAAGINQIGFQITPIVNQTSTAAFTDLLVNRTQTAAGSGVQRLLDLQVGSVSQFSVSNGGTASCSTLNASSGIACQGASAGIGYGTGAGGTVTQGAGSRANGVTINKVTGTITGDNTSLAGLASVTFTVTNTTVAIGDVIIITIRSGPTNSTTKFDVSRVAAGAFDITIYNANVTTADTGAPVINFAVIKAVSA